MVTNACSIGSRLNMNRQSALEVGKIYFGVVYEDDELTYPIINSYEYLGLSNRRPGAHNFRCLGSKDSYVVGEDEVGDFILTTEGVATTLQEWAERNPMLAS